MERDETELRMNTLKDEEARIGQLWYDQYMQNVVPLERAINQAEDDDNYAEASRLEGLKDTQMAIWNDLQSQLNAVRAKLAIAIAEYRALGGQI